MREELLINVNGFETRVALLQNNVLAEIHLQRSGAYSRTGNVYQGKVQRILPGMQAAFVEIGLARPGFLHARDIGPRGIDADGEPVSTPDIRTLVHEGQTLLVQVAKDPIANKGARLTTNLAIASRYLVLMPGHDHIGISQRIDDDVERERLRLAIDELRADVPVAADCGFIARTAAEGVDVDTLAADVAVLVRIWTRIGERAGASAGTVVYEDLPVHTRVIRELASSRLEAVRIDERLTYDRVRDFVAEFLPEFESRVVHHDDATDLFQRFGVDEELGRALEKRVDLRCGGHVVIEQTEAMTTIDVNTGGFVGTRSLEETVFRTNLEAASLVPRQLRLRNLGGIIVVDFIDMDDEEHQRQVLRALERAVEADPARTRLSGFSNLGLVEISRKRTRESLVQQMCQPCPTCTGRAVVKNDQTVCFEVFRAILEHRRRRCATVSAGAPVADCEYVVRACQSVVDRLLDEERGHVSWLEAEVGMPLSFAVEPSYGSEQFDVGVVHREERAH